MSEGQAEKLLIRNYLLSNYASSKKVDLNQALAHMP